METGNLRAWVSNRTNVLIIILAALILIFGGYAATGYLTAGGASQEGITTFTDTGQDICLEDGKPVVLLFSTTRCPHCIWVKPMFDSVVSEYVSQGLIVARHWELDTGDNTLTSDVETSVPPSDMATYNSFSGGYVPAYSIGCRYVRVGNGHEPDLAAEEAELRAAIEDVLQ
jgi:thiol-disulfide isomerase/thioredoxin